MKKIMTPEEIRAELIKIQEKYYTPNSKIARDCKIDTGTMSKFLNGKLETNFSLNAILRLQKWIEDRKVD